MSPFFVWEEGVETREHATEILLCTDAEDAAEEYAKGDIDGLSDGRYQEPGVVLVVEDGRGKRTRVNVTVDWDPTFHAREIEEAAE